MDLARPIEVVFPGARGRVLGALARVEGDLGLRQVARISGTSPAQVSRVLAQLVELGVVERRNVPPVALFRLVDGNLVADMVRNLGRLRSRAIDAMKSAAATLDPKPTQIVLFGSFVSGRDDLQSDIDVLFVRPDGISADDDAWCTAIEGWRRHVERVTGSPVEILEVSAHEFDERLGGVWDDIRRDGISLFGAPVTADRVGSG